MLRELYIETGIALRMLQRGIDRELLVRRDIRRQLREMEGGVPVALRAHHHVTPWQGGAIALVVLYRPDGGVPADLVALCAALTGRGVRVCLIANHPLSEVQRDAFAGHAGEIVERDNQGGDFGAWREMSLELATREVAPGRVLYLNDSVFYGSRGRDAFLDRLIGGGAATYAFENWAEGYHLQSFAFALSGDVFAHEAVQGFWREYRPINNRIHAIETGEKRLSAAVHAATDDIEVIFSVERLARAMEADGVESADIITIPKTWRRRADYTLGRAEVTPFGRARTITKVVAATSPIHAGAYFFPRHLACPLFKKDLVIRERFDFWEIEHWTRGLLPEDERAAYLAELRRRGDPSMLPPMQRRRIAVGL